MILANYTYLSMFRGLSFREAFTRLHEVRSIMPSNIGVMALTATASRPLRSWEGLASETNPMYLCVVLESVQGQSMSF